MTKKLSTKLISKFEKNVSLGVFLLLFSAGFGWQIKPALFYKQKVGVVVDITKSQDKFLLRKNWIIFDTYIFNIDGKEIKNLKGNSENYDYLIGKTIRYKSLRSYTNIRYFSNEILVEIIYNNQTIYSTNEHIKIFVLCSIVFLISLFWCIWAFVKKWKNSATPTKEKNNNNEEIFFDNWGVRKKNDKCTLSYISKMDSNVKYIKINMDDYIAARNGKMNLNDFSEKYNLW